MFFPILQRKMEIEIRIEFVGRSRGVTLRSDMDTSVRIVEWLESRVVYNRMPNVK